MLSLFELTNQLKLLNFLSLIKQLNFDAVDLLEYIYTICVYLQVSTDMTISFKINYNFFLKLEFGTFSVKLIHLSYHSICLKCLNANSNSNFS